MSTTYAIVHKLRSYLQAVLIHLHLIVQRADGLFNIMRKVSMMSKGACSIRVKTICSKLD